jgi:hypothetical protein
MEPTNQQQPVTPDFQQITDVSPTPATPHQTPPQKSGNFLTTLLSLLLLLAVGAAGFFAWQTQNLAKQLQTIVNNPEPTMLAVAEPTSTPDPTANWKTYSNDQSGFSFMFPEDYEVLEDSETIITLSYKSQLFDNPNHYLKIFPQHTVNYSSLKQCGSENTAFPCIPNGKVSDANIGGRVARRFELIKSAEVVGANYEIIQFSEPKIEVEMNLSGGELREVFEQIVSTIKFTVSSPSPTPSLLP